MKRKIRFWLLIAMMMLGVFGSAVTASAAKTTTSASAKKTGWQTSGKYKLYYTTSGKLVTGWRKIGKNLYYFRKKASGDAPKGSMLTGLSMIGSKKFYFSKNGVLQTGWKTINKKNYYFAKTGKAGTIGAMYTGMKLIGKNRFYFTEDGSAAVGWTTYNNKKYFFSNSTKLGTRGRAITGWKKIGKYKYYFGSNGVMQKSRWINNTYYLDASGHMLTSCVTPDGYVVNSSGKKTRVANGWITVDGKKYYYLKGKKTVGWRTISGKKYYFDENGVLQKSEKPDTSSISVLLIAGHGEGDVGAIGTYGSTKYYEYKYTRQFATLIQTQLKALNSGIKVDMYDQSLDCYKQNAKALSGITFTGSGSKKAKVLAAVQKSTTVPDFTQYDYVLEVHFNATVESNKDAKGDGVQKGIGMYINSYKAKKTSNYTIDANIIAAVKKQTGFKVWGGGAGIFKSDGLLNAKTCQELGVSYGLLETAFIDDKDDMTFYNKNKNAMASAVASAIVSYFGS